MPKREGIAAVLKVKKDPVQLDQMVLRDFFAAFAAITLSSMGSPEETARQAYEIADSMLEERVK